MKKFIRNTLSLSFLSLFFFGCGQKMAAGPSDQELAQLFSSNASLFKIALIADSQKQTTLRSAREKKVVFNNKLSDLIMEDAAFRPPITSFVSPASVEYFLGKLSNENPDFIIFLGDVANNGCVDEIADIINVTRAFRNNHQIPIYFLMGNHDHTALGSSDMYRHRSILCGGDENMHSKMDVIKIFSDFNKENNNLADKKLIYHDNVIENEALVRSSCGSRPSADDPLVGYPGEHSREGCFLAGLVHSESKKTNIVLFDTSDYSDLPLSQFDISYFYSKYGNISSTQMNWLNTTITNTFPESGLILTGHYDLPFVKKSALNNLAKYNFINKNKTIAWATAHTHFSDVDPIRANINIKSDTTNTNITLSEINVGSIIDYQMHTMIIPIRSEYQVGSLESSNTIDGYKKITENDDPLLFNQSGNGLCSQIENEVNNFSLANLPTNHLYKPVMGQISGAILFGLTKDYRKLDFKLLEDIDATENNYKLFIQEKISQQGVDPILLKMCLAHIASVHEKFD